MPRLPSVGRSVHRAELLQGGGGFSIYLPVILTYNCDFTLRLELH